MLGFFAGPKNIIDKDQEDWILEQSAWLDDNVGFPDTPVPLFLPTEDFFSRPPESGHERALHVFEDVRSLMGLENWPCELVAQEEDIDPRVGEFTVVQNAPQTPLGTFGVDAQSEQLVVITYNPNTLANVHSLIATFAHELSHYVLAVCDKERTCTVEQEEHLTDLMAIKSGFGLFLANSAFNFGQFSDGFSQGWSTSGQGYLSEREILFALALFMRQNTHDLIEIRPFLKDHLYSSLKKADRYLQRM